jgi:hypothetical protein
MRLMQSTGQILTAACNYTWRDNRGHRAEVKKGQRIGKLRLREPKRWLGRGTRGGQDFVLGDGDIVEVRWEATEGWGYFEAMLGKSARSEGYYREKHVWVPKMAKLEARARAESCYWDDRTHHASVWYDEGEENQRLTAVSKAMLTALLTEKAGWLRWTEVGV